MLSYLFDARTHINDLVWREGNRTEQSWTLDAVPGARFGGKKPVWVLTSKRTFSAAEEFAYDVKNLKRATLVGETTSGAANPGEVVPLTPDFEMFLPTGRAQSPVTQTNWEGVGVAPDVNVPADRALVVAQQLALRALIAAPTAAPHRAALQTRLEELEQAGSL